MAAPTRYQRSRRKGHHVPAGVTYVGRPTKWANPFGKQELRPRFGDGWREEAGRRFHRMIAERRAGDPSERGSAYPSDEEIRAELVGLDLSCWCPIPKKGEPDWCHAAALISIANDIDDPTLR
ncbi:DUF4326 domain-containing protein [Stackebrandtia soli]|uniref:DUF4326 domain-containing protein n=1 Tax=Stackebrandtia soli TaxID=1892856 RepID=UPI0039E86E5A